MTTLEPVTFEFEADNILPHCARQGGHPYTGFGCGSASGPILDWGGWFLDGLPHGRFFLCWGDRMTMNYLFEHGVELASPPDEA